MKFKIFRFKNVNSTNNSAIRIIKNSNTNYGMIIANEQKRGKGQYGKKWISYNGNLFVSFFYRLDHLNVSLKRISTVADVENMEKLHLADMWGSEYSESNFKPQNSQK